MNFSKTIIGKNPALKSLLRSVKIIAATDVNVLIAGETGTGKELIAVAIQKSSRRTDNVFITLNCAALPESLIESKLFGYCKGAFTGADTDKLVSAGKFRQDLYFRLNVVQLEPPPLRRRRQDIKLLRNHFMSYFAQKHAVITPSISQEVLEALENYRWPRLDWYKLEINLIQQALAKSNGKCKEASQLLGISRDALYYRIKKYGLTLD